LHVQELYRNEGYLHAQVGPAQVIRRRCSPRSPAGVCKPVPLPHPPVDACTYDATSLPLPVAPLDTALSCSPDPAHGIECEPLLSLRIPIKLGPRSILYDVAFTGVVAIPEKQLAAAANLTLGDPANVLKLDEARRKIIDAYKEEGFAYVDVKYSLDTSLDHTRTRARFDVVEGERVFVREIIIRGNELTSEAVIQKRVALEVGKPYRTSDIRKTQERIATLNVFSSVNVSLEDPYAPQSKKTVIVTVSERDPQYIDRAIGVSTGEGFRLRLEYGHRNLGGDAIGFSLRIQLSYLPDFLILDPTVRQTYDTALPSFGDRIATRSTASFAFPDVGLGPLVRGSVDGVLVRDLERDFALTKGAAIFNLYYRPIRQVQLSISPDFEVNDALIFNSETVNQYLEEQQGASDIADLARLLRVPTGSSGAAAQRFLVTWDRRDNTFNAHKGTYIAAGVEHVDWHDLTAFNPLAQCSTVSRPTYQQLVYGQQGWLPSGGNSPLAGKTLLLVGGQPTCDPVQGHFLRFTETFSAYVPVTKKITLAAELRLGTNVQLVGPAFDTESNSASYTYPDRLFFVGGIESMRGYLQDTLVPQDLADRIARDFGKPDSDPTKFTIAQVPLRGGNLMINPRAELRIPLFSPFETVLFFDSGNLWSNAAYIFQSGHGFPPLRTAVGTGLRLQTPIGPVVFDYGINLSRLVTGPNDPRRTYEDFGAFHFAIGLF
jgi:outer membrane protein insertion porin family